MRGQREQLVEVVRSQAAAADVCQAAGVAILGELLCERLAGAGIAPTPDLAVGIMATAMLLAEESPEFGGDARDVLAAVAALGLDLLERGPG